MSEQKPNAPLIDNLNGLEKGIHNLESVLDTMFQMFEAQGIKPTYHLTAAIDKVRQNASEASVNGKRTVTQLEQLQELMRTSALINSSLEIDQVLEEVMDTIVSLIGAERAYLMLYDDHNQLQMKAARNWDRQTIGGKEAEFSNTIINMALQEGTPIITTNAQDDERFKERASIMVQQLRSIICVPLMLRGKIVGVLYADNRYKHAVFAEDLAPLLAAFGSQAAIAITNATLFGQVRTNLAQAEAELSRLRIAIDRSKLNTQVDAIVGSEYFEKVSEAAKKIRAEKSTREQKAITPQEVEESKKTKRK
jgi:transcriptional regulator with GAF, ATPase, and Fis domain